MSSIPDFKNEEATSEFFRNLANVYHGAAEILLKAFPENEQVAAGCIDIKSAANKGLLLILHPFIFY